MTQKHMTPVEYALTINEKFKDLTTELIALDGKFPQEDANKIYNKCVTWCQDFNGLQVTEIGNLLKSKLKVKLSLFQKDLLEATILLRHWAGRNSGGVSQFEGKAINRLIECPNTKIEESKAQDFLARVIAL